MNNLRTLSSNGPRGILSLCALTAACLMAPQHSCAEDVAAAGALTDRVNMFLGTDSSAMTVPAAIRPFGMISPGPFNRFHVPSGYLMRTSDLIGFNHTHLQGTGCGSYGVLVVLPTTGGKELGTTVKCPAKNQSAVPGYFQAMIDEMQICAEMTCTKRAAIHRYRFPQSDSARILVDTHQGVFYKDGDTIAGTLAAEGNTALSGSVTTSAWKEHTTYFYIEFSKPFAFTGKGDQGGYVSYATAAGEEILMKVGISYVSAENARLNLKTEIPAWDFDGVKSSALAEWNRVLGKIEIRGGTPDQQVNFYSSLYHSQFHPQLTSDVNDQYRGLDGNVHTAEGHNHYSVLSTWDTFRAAHPLYTLIAPDVQLDVIKTMIDDYQDSGWSPRWKLACREAFCMPGTWADVIVPDAYIKGITQFDTQTAWKMVCKNATVPGRRDNLPEYLKLGYVPYPSYINVTRTLENSYCDFSLAQFAQALGQPADEAQFRPRAQNYKTLWDPQTLFFRGKDRSGHWSYPDNFNPLTYTGKGNNDYCEGNAWQWLWHVMQDMQGLINLMGGDAAFEAKMDQFLQTAGGHETSKFLGQYWHGNEPDQHALYGYNFVGKPAKSAEKLRLCMANEYLNTPEGLKGNEDAGQMSAWYLFSAMGFYPFTHAVPQYVIGTPLFDEVTMHLSGGDFKVKALHNSAENMYIQSAQINGKPWDNTWLPHSALMQGATVEFLMGDKPSQWGTSPDSRPFSISKPTAR